MPASTEPAATAVVYRDGRIERTAAVEEITALRDDAERVTWVDLVDPDHERLERLAELLHLHPLAVEDVEESEERAKLVRYETHLFLTLYALALTGPGPAPAPQDRIVRHEVDVFVAGRVVVTVRRADGFDIDCVRRGWEAHPGLLAAGPMTLVWAIVDHVVDTHFDTVQALDEEVEQLEAEVLGTHPDAHRVQRDAYLLHKQLVVLRRLALPTREIVSSIINRSDPPLPDALQPYLLDVYDHVLRVSDWTDSLRDLASTIVDTNLSSQGNRMNLVMKKLTAWAAIIAVPTLITGFFGMNVDLPLFGTGTGGVVAIALVALTSVGLYIQFKVRDWL